MTPEQYAKFLAFKQNELDQPPPKDWWTDPDPRVASGERYIKLGTMMPYFEKLFPDWSVKPIDAATHHIIAKKKGQSFETLANKLTVELTCPLWLKNADTGMYEYITTIKRIGSACVLRSNDSAAADKSPQSANSMALKNAISMLGIKFGRVAFLTNEGMEFAAVDIEKAQKRLSEKVTKKLNANV